MTLKVIGAGLGRTGTVSLKLALEQLGIGRCYHMMELITHPDHTALWQRAVEGRPDWPALFADYAGTTDYPACLFWRELADFYPDAKAILTVRDAESWFQSTQATVFAPGRSESLPDPALGAAFHMIERLHRQIHDHDSMVADFRRHNEAVIAGIAKNRLLIYEVRQGWEPLCAFLGVPVPDAPFPRANTREEMKDMLAQVRRAGKIDAASMREAIGARLARLEAGIRKPKA
ncbi:MAG: sulfotransferase family protein [Stellaceae bacterium]